MINNGELLSYSKLVNLIIIGIVLITNFITIFVTGNLVRWQLRMVFNNETSNEVINRKRYVCYSFYYYLCFISLIETFRYPHFWKSVRLLDGHYNEVYLYSSPSLRSFSYCLFFCSLLLSVILSPFCF